MIVLKGKVASGKGRGRRIGFPTVNIPVSRRIKKDQWGIYFSIVKVDDKFYPGATHLGPVKTFFSRTPTCETYLLTLQDNLYGKTIEKKLMFKFRDIEQFPNLAKLKKQIKKDVKAAKKFFGI